MLFCGLERLPQGLRALVHLSLSVDNFPSGQFADFVSVCPTGQGEE